MYCVEYGGLGSTEHCVHNVCTVWCMVVWVVLNIVYIMCVYCVVYGGLGSTEHWVHNVCTVWSMVVSVVLSIVYSCVCSPLLDVMNVLGTCCGDFVNGQVFLDEFYFLHNCFFFIH